MLTFNENKRLTRQCSGRLTVAADFVDKLTASYAHVQLIGGGCFAIALTDSAHAPPIKAIELTAPQYE